MADKAEEKLREVYDNVVVHALEVIEVFNGEFGEELVDYSMYSFEEFLEWLDTQTLGSLGITTFTGRNSFGSYQIDVEDYKVNGKGRKFLEYIPDLGIIDYLRPMFVAHIKTCIAAKNNTPEEIPPTVNIIVRFPEVTITNENDKSIQIKELYVKVHITLEGRLTDWFYMTRTEYDVAQWLNGYVHSHLPSLMYDHPEEFMAPCTGDGPINLTMKSLRRTCDLNLWSLFTFELAKYVTVESLNGVPYKRLENVGANDRNLLSWASFSFTSTCPNYRGAYSSKRIKQFCIYFLKLGQMKFAYNYGGYTLGEDARDFNLRVTKAFIEWHNNNVITTPSLNISPEALYSSGLLKKVIVVGPKMYNTNFTARVEEIKHYEGREMFRFKGEMKTLHITKNLGEYSYTSIIDTAICNYILTLALKIINHRYGREEEDNSVNRKPYYF